MTQLTAGQVTQIPLGNLRPDPDQPRKTFDQASLAQLAASLKRGVQVPLLVRTGKGGKYVIHDGERRYRAAKLAKLKTLPVLLIEHSATEEDLRSAQLAVNNLREKFTPMEVARMLSGLRAKRFATVNDLAAHLDHCGLPAMTPQQITQTIALVDLPEWAQAMIDAGQIEAADAGILCLALPYPQVLADAHKEIKRDVAWKGRLTGNELCRELTSAFRDHGVNLDRTNEWNGDDAVFFNPQTVCKRCEHLIKIDGRKFCMNPPEFERRNAEAKAAGLLPGGKKPSKPLSPGKLNELKAEIKQEKRQQTLGEKVREYLHGYLIQRLVHHMRLDIDITDELLAWHAMGRPGETYGRRPALAPYEASKEAEVSKLEDLIAVTSLDKAKKCAAIELALGLKWRETQALCHDLWGSSIESVWSIDGNFVGLFRKAELMFLAETHRLTPPEGKAWDKLKASELKAEILKRADQMRRPAILQDTYADIAEPYVPWGDRPDEADLTDEYAVCDGEDVA